MLPGNVKGWYEPVGPKYGSRLRFNSFIRVELEFIRKLPVNSNKLLDFSLT